MENKNLPAFPAMDSNYIDGVPHLELRYEGLTKREYFAIHCDFPLPDLFCLQYLREYQKENGGYTKTDGSYYDMLSSDQKAEVRAKWKVKCADALLAALDQPVNTH